ncbi:MAG: NMD3-related protein [Thermoplasmata archaeon]
MFCVECGREGKTYEGLCSECYLRKKQLIRLPEILDVMICGKCFAAHIGKHWVDSLDLEDAIRLSIENAVSSDKNVSDVEVGLTLNERDPRNYSAHVTVSFRAGELTASRAFDIQVRLKKDTCQRCGKKSGHYYEAILQLRGSGESFDRNRLERARRYFLKRMEKISSESRDAFVSKEEPIHGGFDFYVSSSSVAKGLAREMGKMFGAQVKTTHSIAGRKDGHELTRMTYLVRLPEYDAGDILEMDGRYYLLRRFEGNNLNLVDLRTWHESNVSLGRLAAVEVLHRKTHVFSASVISESDREVCVRDPETQDGVRIQRPEGYPGGQTAIGVVRTKKGLLLVP